MINILIFTILTVINVTLSTIRSLATIKCGKWVSALANAVCYGFYPLIVMLTAKDMVTIVANMIITALANFVCVWIIKYVEEKARKDKMWKVEMAIPNSGNIEWLKADFENNGIPCNYITVGSWVMFNCYCMKQEQTARVVDIAKALGGKYSAYESKI
jgi:hypothetical protein